MKLFYIGYLAANVALAAPGACRIASVALNGAMLVAIAFLLVQRSENP